MHGQPASLSAEICQPLGTIFPKPRSDPCNEIHPPSIGQDAFWAGFPNVFLSGRNGTGLGHQISPCLGPNAERWNCACSTRLGRRELERSNCRNFYPPVCMVTVPGRAARAARTATGCMAPNAPRGGQPLQLPTTAARPLRDASTTAPCAGTMRSSATRLGNTAGGIWSFDRREQFSAFVVARNAWSSNHPPIPGAGDVPARDVSTWSRMLIYEAHVRRDDDGHAGNGRPAGAHARGPRRSAVIDHLVNRWRDTRSELPARAAPSTMKAT